MDKLPIITKQVIGTDEVNAVNARDLHKALESKQDFSTWIKARIEKLKLKQGVDFEVFHKSVENPNGGRPAIEHIITTDIAKHLCMLEMTDKGHEVRSYFIECEKKLQVDLNNPKIMLNQLIEMAQKQLVLIEQNERLMLENQNKQDKINLLTHTNKTYTITEIAKELNMKSAIELNKALAKMKVQFQSNGTWVFYSKYANLGYEIIKQEVLDNGHVAYYRKITQTGREFILSLFDKKESRE